MIRILPAKYLLLSLLLLPAIADAISYPISVTLTGSQEVPANNSAATGTLVGSYNDSTNVLKYTVTFGGLTANTTAAHFHAPAPPGISAGVVFPATGFPLGVTSGTYTDSITLSAGQEDTLKMGLWYFNIHNNTFPGGEIRGQIFLQSSSFVVPDILCPSSMTVSNDPGMCSASVNFASGDTTGIPSSTIYYRIGTTRITSPRAFPIGTTRVVAVALNAAGADSCSFTVTVNDTQAPVIICPANITVPNDPGVCGAVVNFNATATDNCSGVTITYDHAPGSFFPVGTTNVQAFAGDAAGNRDTCVFTVTVNDVEPPVINDLNATPSVLWPPNHKMRNVQVNYSATDNCPGPITCHITVTSNETQTGPGNNHAPDWQIIDDHRILLRAERNGNGSGRIYSIEVECTDQHGNSSSEKDTVRVAHDLHSALIRHLLNLGAAFPRASIVMQDKFPGHSSVVRVYPNPSNSYFSINIEAANNADRISVRLLDMSGRGLELKDGLQGSQTITMGQNLKPGIYIVQITQGNESKLIKIIKQ